MNANEAIIKEMEKLKKENNELKGKQDIEKVKRSSNGLKDVLFRQLDNILGDNPDYKKANTVAKMVKTIADVSKVELEYAKFSKELEKDKETTLAKVNAIQMR